VLVDASKPLRLNGRASMCDGLYVNVERLPNSLQLAGIVSRDEATAALAAIGRDAATRAEVLEPREFVGLAQGLP
jgi:hypothetical protein